MRLVSQTRRTSEDDLSLPVASSVSTVDSRYEIFDSDCSDFSEGEDNGERGEKPTGHSTPYSSFSASYCSAMEPRSPTERAALVSGAPTVYHSLSSDTLGRADLSDKAVLSTQRRLQQDNWDPQKKTQSSLVTIFSVWNTTMGSSLLTMAWGVERAGLLPALALLVLMGALCLFTAHVLLEVNRHHGGASCEVPALCRVLLGPWAERLAHTFSLLVLVGANVVYWILITNFLYFTVNYFVDINAANKTEYPSALSCNNGSSLLAPDAPAAAAAWDPRRTVPLYVAVLVFPLLNFRSATFFTKFNSLGTLSVVYLVIFVLVKGSAWGVHLGSSLVGARAGVDAAALSGMLALSFYIHNIIITIMSGNARQENNGRDLTIAFALVTVTYMLVGTIFYVCFPMMKACIEDNLLNNFEMHDVMTAVARMLLLFQVITVYPLVAYMLRREALLLLPLSAPARDSRAATLAVNAAVVALCVACACVCPNIGTIIRYTGAVSGLVHVFALPALLQLRSLRARGRLTRRRAALYAAVVAVGALNLLMQFFISG